MKSFNSFALFFILLLGPVFSQASTVDNIKLLNQFAEKLFAPDGPMQKEVDDRFTKMGLNPTLVPKLSDRYKVFIPENTDCFWDNKILFLADFDIYGPSDFAIMKRQFLAAANFLKEVHVSTRGQDLGFFHPKSIDFCPLAKMNNRNMFYQSGTLTVGIDNPVGMEKYEAVSSKLLMDRWDRGDIFTNGDDDEGQIFEVLKDVKDKAKDMITAKLKGKDPRSEAKKLWFLINPIGKFRSDMRDLLQGRAMKLKREIIGAFKENALPEEKAITGQEVAAMPDQNPKVTRALLADYVEESVDQEKLKDELGEQTPRQWVESLSDDEIADLKKIWTEQLSNASLTESIGQTIVEELQSPVYADDIEVNVHQTGGVAVENAHVITSNLSFAKANVKKFVAPLVPRKMRFNVTQNAGVAVSTKDIVTSFATIIVPNSKIVESLSFQDVFEKMKKLKRQKAAKALGLPSGNIDPAK